MLAVDLTFLAFALSLLPCVIPSPDNFRPHGHSTRRERYGVDVDHDDARHMHNVPDSVRPTDATKAWPWDYASDDPDEESDDRTHAADSPFRFNVSVTRLSCRNVKIVVRPSTVSTSVLRYVLAFWPKRRPQEWMERFSDGGRHWVVTVPIAGLHVLRSTEWVVRVTALLGDGSNRVVNASFRTLKRCGTDDHSAKNTLQRCYPKITEKLWSRQTLYVAWTKSCDASVFDRYAVNYRTNHDYRQMYVSINNNSVTFRDMIEVPYELSVAGVHLIEPFRKVTSDIVSFSTGHIDVSTIPVVVTTPTTSAGASFVTKMVSSRDGPQMSNDGLLVAVIILSILFVSSAVVALYLCCYLRIHKRNLRLEAAGQDSQQTPGNLDSNGKQDLKVRSEEEQATEGIDVTAM